MALDATVGGANSNSYIAVATADALLADRLYVSAWTAATTAIKEAALIWATGLLDPLDWKGTIADEAQALRWPRGYVYNADGIELADDAIPLAVQRATAEYALELVKEDLVSSTDTSNIQSIAAGPVDISFYQTRARKIPDYVMDRLSGLIVGTAFGQMAGSRKVVRV